ncbi:MAG: ribosome silencing factor [Candidatus Zixiibacteriota bacterium]
MAISSHDLALLAANFALDKKAADVVILDLRELTSVTDFFVICSGSAHVHVKAIADHIKESLTQEDQKPWHIEGLPYGSWVLMDCIDVVVHVFLKERREFYGLERLWGDAPIERVKEEYQRD